MEKKLTLQELAAWTIREMERVNFSAHTIKAYRGHFDRLDRYADEIGMEPMFTEELGDKFLQVKYGYPPDKDTYHLTSHVKSAVAAIRRLGEMQCHGAFSRNHKSRKSLDWVGSDGTFIESYRASIAKTGVREVTSDGRINRLKPFYEFLAFRKITSISEVVAQGISDYTLSLQGWSRITIKGRLAELKLYLRFLFKNGLLPEDLSYAVPTVKAAVNLNVPALWSKDDIDKLLADVDRGSPIGKRNYAIFILVIQLGIRNSDIAEMQLNNLKWERKTIEFSQHKTGKFIACPLTDDAGWAIIDYIRYARPQSEEPYLFLTTNAPYSKMAYPSVGGILVRQMRSCGLTKIKGVRSGMHSLRHTLARRLLEKNTSLETISSIMGHTTVSSSSPYLKVDIDGLRECGLSLGEVCENV
jgi:site-specific recombinase XerD